MPGADAIRILRGAQSYDPAQREDILQDGQPFYSKKTGEFFIGDGSTKIKNLVPVGTNHLDPNGVIVTDSSGRLTSSSTITSYELEGTVQRSKINEVLSSPYALTWDGNIENKTIVEGSNYSYVLVSSETP